MGTFTDWLFGRTKKKEEVHAATVLMDATPTDTVKTYTAEEVHAELTSKFLLFMEDIKRTTEYKAVPDSVRQEYETLEKLGFINSKNAELTGRIIRYVNDSNKKHEENIEALHFMKKAWETFGKDVMVVRYDHFFELLKKYNLVCGSFDRYTGTIPPENLVQIAQAMDSLSKHFNMVEFFVPIRYGNLRIRYNWSELDFSRFDLYPVESYVRELIPINFSAINRESFAYEIYSYQRYHDYEYMDIKHLNAHYCFIAAPAQEMKESYVMRAQRTRQLELERVRTYDPFICSLTKYGVMIFTKWGNEAQDDIIKRYEELSKYVNG